MKSSLRMLFLFLPPSPPRLSSPPFFFFFEIPFVLTRFKAPQLLPTVRRLVLFAPHLIVLFFGPRYSDTTSSLTQPPFRLLLPSLLFFFSCVFFASCSPEPKKPPCFIVVLWYLSYLLQHPFFSRLPLFSPLFFFDLFFYSKKDGDQPNVFLS